MSEKILSRNQKEHHVLVPEADRTEGKARALEKRFMKKSCDFGTDRHRSGPSHRETGERLLYSEF